MIPCVQSQNSFESYVGVMSAARDEIFYAAAEEVNERLAFIFLCLTEINSLAEQHYRNMQGIAAGRFSLENPGIHQPIFLRIKFFTDAIYINAFRVREILRHKDRMLPGLANFEAKGVRDVRNNLLIHPEGKGSKILSISFMWDRRVGSIIKPKRLEHEAGRHVDQGLLPNMEEFFRSFEETVSLASSAQSA